MSTFTLPGMIRIHQRFDSPVLDDIPGTIVSRIQSLNLEKKVRSGQTVAVACSSRGIANYSSLVRAVVRTLKELGLKPFIIPAMGSHGAATPDGQKRVLLQFGISEESMHVPVRSSLKTVLIGETDDHIPVFIDELAFKADYIVPVNRIKSHTDFVSDIESGLMKMLAVGLGKKNGASIYHQAFFRYGYAHVILSVARKILEEGKILFGVAIIENELSQTSNVGIVNAEEMEEKEKQYLKEAKSLEPRLPFEKIDLLIVDEMGKDISGSGMDTKVIGRIHLPVVSKEPETPRIKRIVVCGLTEKSEGNALGIGLADFVTRRLVDRIDWPTTMVNALIGGSPEHAKVPLTLPSDREAILTAAESVGASSSFDLRIMRIQNTKSLGEVDVSHAYRDEIEQRSDLEVIEEKCSLRFDSDGRIKSFK